MTEAWIAAILLSATLAGLCFGCHEQFPIQQVSASKEAIIPCPHLDTPSSANFSLLKNGVKVASSTIGQNWTAKSPRWTPAGMAFQVHAHNDSHFTLSPEMVNRTGLYTCRIEDQSSPSEASGPEGQSHLIILETCPNDCTSDSPSAVFWPWAVGCGLLAIYSLVIIKITVKIWHKLKQCDSNETDYMNMKPRGFRGHMGIQQLTRVRMTK
ncbi:uncharacterized protein LOC108942693 [Scleropages formosus]|uniref:uncharacterized protein LOC108942693 n=1 Tax=Scleropages formosus TaxID=113540 RepID=UPI000877EBAA|nr:uncharacterized protein LOC108942693 [Scleropages formosus]